jgi:outer membrane protein assembly factor BamE (lipoprotein component of BamABCDE complex)
MKPLSSRIAMVLMIAAGSLALPGCARLKGHQGYVVDVDLVNSVQPGVDNRTSVAQVLGRPTFTSTFDEREWYYVSRDTRFYAYNNPKARDQMVLRVRFDDKGVVTAVDRTGIEKVASINPYGKTTPTLGRNRTFFQDLFGNIGSVGAGQGPQGPGQGGTRDQP